MVSRLQKDKEFSIKLAQENRKKVTLKEKIEPDPRDQKIKELLKEVNALDELVLAMQDQERKHYEWMNYCLTYLNKPKPEDYEQRERELHEAYSQSIQNCNGLKERIMSLTLRKR